MQNTLARRELTRILWNLAVTPDASIGVQFGISGFPLKDAGMTNSD